MRVLVIGELAFGELGRSYMDAFRACDVEVEGVDYAVEYRHAPLASNRFASRLLQRVYATAMSSRIVERARQFRPDLVLVIKGHLLSPSAITTMQSVGAKVFNYFPDSPFTKSRSNASPWLLRALPRYDVFLTFAAHLIPQLHQAGCRNVIYLPFAVDPALHQPVSASEDLTPYRCDVCFVGNVDAERAPWLRLLADYDLKLWGAAYPPSFSSDPKLRQKIQGRPLIGTELAMAARASKINLNLMRTQNLGSHNMRTYEMPACRAFVLSQRTPEVLSLFVEDKEAVYFSTPEELCAKVDYYLARPLERDRIAEAGWRRAQQETYAHRAAQILEEYEKLAGTAPTVEPKAEET